MRPSPACFAASGGSASAQKRQEAFLVKGSGSIPGQFSNWWPYHLSFSMKFNNVVLERIVFIFKLIVLPPEDDGASGRFGAGSVALV